MFDNTQAFSEGWGLFETDDGVTQIQRLDDPRSVSPNYPDEPIFASDADALAFVIGKSSSSAYHKRAVDTHGKS